MTGVELMLSGVAVFFGLNMGGSGFAPAFAAAVGSKAVSRRRALALYSIAVIVGALALGSTVARTLAGGIIPEELVTPERALIILGSATVALFVANILKVPQSTSWVTVFALAATGAALGQVRYETIVWRLLPAWIGLPVASYLLTRVLVGRLYPLRPANFRLHERLVGKTNLLHIGIVGSACYVAAAIGSNNVANIVGPVTASGLTGTTTGFLLAAPLFGLGAILFPEPARTVATAIVPIGALAAVIVSLVVGTLLFAASSIGIPQSLVQLNAAAVMAVWRAKNQGQSTMEHRMVRRILVLWLVTPVIAALLATIATWTFE